MTPREKKNAQNREYYARKREALLAKQKEYYAQNRERIVAQKSEYQRRPEVKYLRKLRRCEFSQSVSV